MLILHRRVDQWITITHAGETLSVCLTSIDRDVPSGHLAARIGFEGPRSFAIDRDDRWLRPPLDPPPPPPPPADSGHPPGRNPYPGYGPASATPESEETP